MGEPCPSYTDELGFHPADGRAWRESLSYGGLRRTEETMLQPSSLRDHPVLGHIEMIDYRPHPDACSPNCNECIPCLKELLTTARLERDRSEARSLASYLELIRLRGRLLAIANELREAS